MARKARVCVQFPGESFCFPCGCSGILPELGEGNDFASWRKKPTTPRGGCWYCRVCSCGSARAYGRGVGPTGLLGWAKNIIAQINKTAKLGAYIGAKITPEELVHLREESTYCCDGCGEKLNWCTDGSFRNPSLHHNHKTGEVRGFTTAMCNRVEGDFDRIGNGDSNLQRRWLEYHFPNTVEPRRET
jgi:recombination endonuclease VII